jgi:hypothetical protein
MGPDNGVTGSLTGRGVHGALCGDDIGSAWAAGTSVRLSVDSNTNVRTIPLALPLPFTPWLRSPSEDLAPLRSIRPCPSSKTRRLISVSGVPRPRIATIHLLSLPQRLRNRKHLPPLLFCPPATYGAPPCIWPGPSRELEAETSNLGGVHPRCQPTSLPKNKRLTWPCPGLPPVHPDVSVK